MPVPGMRMVVDAGPEQTEVIVSADDQIAYSQSLRAGRAEESAVFEAVRIALERVASIGLPERVELMRGGPDDETFAERLSQHLGLPVILGE